MAILISVLLVVTSVMFIVTSIAAQRSAYWAGWFGSRVDMIDRYTREVGEDGTPPQWLRGAVTDDAARILVNRPWWELPPKPPKLMRKALPPGVSE
jgi:hypothetical protein